MGNGLSIEQEHSHFALWAIMKGPLLMGTDLTNLTQEQIDILQNKYLLAFNLSSWPVTLVSLAVGKVAFAGFTTIAHDKVRLTEAADGIFGVWREGSAIVAFAGDTTGITFELDAADKVASIHSGWGC